MRNVRLSITLLFISLAPQCSLRSQVNGFIADTANIYNALPPKKGRQHAAAESRFNARSYMIPGFMIAYGFTAIETKALKGVDNYVQHEMYAERPHPPFKMDDYLQFAPGVMAFGLDLAGIKAKHDFKDRSIMVLMSNMISNAAASSIKKRTHQLRPGSNSYGSFPSAHTAYAFANAEFLRQEYKDISPWYGVIGYGMAAGTGYLRMYNNKHWLSDVVAGAGVGILSTKIVYWLYPLIRHSLLKNKLPGTVLMPTYQDGAPGFGLVHKF